MSQRTDNPGGVSLLSTLLPSVILLASTTLTLTDHDPGDGANKFLLSDLAILLDRDNTVMALCFDDVMKSSEKIENLHSARFNGGLGRDDFNILTTSEQSSENEDEKIAEVHPHPSFLASSLLIGSLLSPSLLAKKKYEARVDHHQSCHLQTCAMSNVFPDTRQTLEVRVNLAVLHPHSVVMSIVLIL